VTPRTLMAIIRMTIALAKFRLCDEVTEWDVQEALRLIEVSREAIDSKHKMVVNKGQLIKNKILHLLDTNGGEYEEVSMKMQIANELRVSEMDVVSEISNLVNKNLLERLDGNIVKI